MNVGPGFATTMCMFCSTQLTFPSTSQYIKCPQCQNTFPAAPPPPVPHSYVSCAGCNTLLSHPPTSMTIQCPKCLIIMDLVNRGNGGAGALAAAGAPGTPGGVGAVGDKAGLAGATGNRKKRKDPAAPKRASNAYMIFCKERRVTLKQERPDLPFGQLGKTLGEMWRSMTVEEKKPWEDRATSERDRYKQEMNTYQTNQMLKAAPDAGVGGDSLGGSGGAPGSDGGSDDPSGSLPADGETPHKKAKLQQSNDSESEENDSGAVSSLAAPGDAAASAGYLNSSGDLNGTSNGAENSNGTSGEEDSGSGLNHGETNSNF